MATPLATGTWKRTKGQGAGPYTVPLSLTASAGNTIIFAAAGGAICTPSGFTRADNGYGGGVQDVSIWAKTAAGGETSISVTQSGAENCGGYFRVYQETLTRVGGSNNGTGQTPASSSNYAISPAVINPTATHSLGLSIYSATQSTAYSAANKFRSHGPWANILVDDANQDSSSTFKCIYFGAEFDMDTTHSFPSTQTASHYLPTTTYQLGASCFASCAYFTDTSGVTTVPHTSNLIADENTLPGADRSNWDLATAGTNGTIAGYCDQCSYSAGDTVNFKVDSTAHTYSVSVFRLGFYGYDNFLARQVSPTITGTVVTQPSPVTDGTLGSTSCGWTTSATWTIPSDAVPGIYYVIFRRTDVGGTTNASTGHFTVKGSATGKMNVVIPDIGSHQPYNLWAATTDHGLPGAGGATYTTSSRSLYGVGSDGSILNIAHRAYAVSFDRPYSVSDNNPATYLFDATFGQIVFLEMMGYNLNYFSDMDTENNTTLLNAALMVLLVGHHEYCSKNTLDCYANAKAASVNFFISSSNTMGWRVRFAAADTSKKTEICYKDSMTRDVAAGFTGTGFDLVSPTGTWRDALSTNGIANPDKRLDNAFTGQRFVASGPTAASMTFDFNFKGKPIWRNSAGVQALTTGTHVTDISNSIGDEVDSADGSTGQPSNLVIVAQTSFSTTVGSNANGTIYATSATLNATWSLYLDPSGALVFNTGNWRSWWSATREQAGTKVASVLLDVQNALNAALYDLGGTPSTPGNTLQAGVDTALTNPSVGAPTRGNSTVATAYGLSANTNWAGAASFVVSTAITTAAKEIVSAVASMAVVTTVSAGIFASRPSAATFALVTSILAGASKQVTAAVTAALNTSLTVAAQEILPAGANIAVLTNLVAHGSVNSLATVNPVIDTVLNSNPDRTTFAGASLAIEAALNAPEAVDNAASVTLALVTQLAASALNLAGVTATPEITTGLTVDGTPVKPADASFVVDTVLDTGAEKLTFAQASMAAVMSLIASNTPVASSTLHIDTNISTLLNITAPVAAHMQTDTEFLVQGLAGMFGSAMLAIDAEFQADGALVPASGVQALMQVATRLEANTVDQTFVAAALHVLAEITANATVIAQVVINQQVTWILNDTRWRFTDVMRRISQLSREFVTAQAYSTTFEDLTSQAVQFAFTANDTVPVDADWHDGVWMTEGVNVAAILVGPEALALSPGKYDVWVRVTDNTESPVRDIGQVTIY